MFKPSDRPSDNLIGESASFLEVLDQVSQLAPLNKPVLIVGERGTGKELIAARLHYLSTRWDQPFVKMNCAALNENLLETELFGHEAGAFTGASKKHTGRFELADGGSLFLDELATTSDRVQEKLLRVIEYSEFERVGGSKTINTDVRLIAATNEDLPLLAQEGRFRADLLDRLAFDVVTLPPLRARPEDILTLAEHFAIKMTKELEREFFAGFSVEAKNQLLQYDWPGNVRELKNVIERNVYRHDAEVPIADIILDPFDSPWRPRAKPAPRHAKKQTNENASTESAAAPAGSIQVSFPLDFKDHIQTIEVDVLQMALEQSQFNQKKSAELLGLTYHQLRGYLKKYSLLENN